ncbi:unnamed protein product [Effrenium voratum]|uniref:EF-hand domain-containing protein n=1 Tax=Effrenium voratum TaxID=2562239 RepID=A0AA36HRE1_9DINO|nr:unnamed protein product [Effrenium voratum]
MGGGKYGGKDGGKGGYGGGYGGYGGYGLGGESEEMEVDDRDIGRIIGRGGCNIKDLQEGTRCKIITPTKRDDNDDPTLRKVVIQGTKEQIARCKEAINGVLMGEEPKDVLAQLDGAVLIKNVEPMSMGHLAKIKSRIETELNVRIELDARSARIWSKDNDRDKAMDAKEKIEEEMEDITTVDSLTVNVPANIVNQVINDSALRQLQDQTGLTANVCKNDQGTGIRLTGLSGAIQEAKGLIERRSSGEGAEFLALMPGLFQKLAPKKYADFQRDLGFLMQNSGAQVTIAEGSNRADFRGGPEEVRHAKSELQKILHFYFEQECDTIDLPPESVNWVAGDDDRELMRLQSAGAVIALDRSAATLWMCGNPRSVEQVRNRIRNSLQRWDREHAVIHLQSRQSAWAIIGSGGSTIRELQSSTQARIDVDADNQRVTISGREESVREAKGRIMEIIGSRGGGWGGGGGGFGGNASGQNDYDSPVMTQLGFEASHNAIAFIWARAAMTGAADEAAAAEEETASTEHLPHVRRVAAMAAFDPAPYCIPGEITVHEVLDMKRAFDMIDEDNSGVIDAEELQGAAVALGIPMEENISVLLGTDKINFDEFFKRMTAKLSPSDKVDDIMGIFELFDNDATGTISFENMQNVARIIGAKESPQEIQAMLSTLEPRGVYRLVGEDRKSTEFEVKTVGLRGAGYQPYQLEAGAGDPVAGRDPLPAPIAYLYANALRGNAAPAAPGLDSRLWPIPPMVGAEPNPGVITDDWILSQVVFDEDAEAPIPAAVLQTGLSIMLLIRSRLNHGSSDIDIIHDHPSPADMDFIPDAVSSHLSGTRGRDANRYNTRKESAPDVIDLEEQSSHRTSDGSEQDTPGIGSTPFDLLDIPFHQPPSHSLVTLLNGLISLNLIQIKLNFAGKKIGAEIMTLIVVLLRLLPQVAAILLHLSFNDCFSRSTTRDDINACVGEIKKINNRVDAFEKKVESSFSAVAGTLSKHEAKFRDFHEWVARSEKEMNERFKMYDERSDSIVISAAELREQAESLENVKVQLLRFSEIGALEAEVRKIKDEVEANSRSVIDIEGTISRERTIRGNVETYIQQLVPATDLKQFSDRMSGALNENSQKQEEFKLQLSRIARCVKDLHDKSLGPNPRDMQEQFMKLVLRVNEINMQIAASSTSTSFRATPTVTISVIMRSPGIHSIGNLAIHAEAAASQSAKTALTMIDLIAFLIIISGMALLLILDPGHHVEIRHIGVLNRTKGILVSVPTPELLSMERLRESFAGDTDLTLL